MLTDHIWPLRIEDISIGVRSSGPGGEATEYTLTHTPTGIEVRGTYYYAGGTPRGNEFQEGLLIQLKKKYLELYPSEH